MRCFLILAAVAAFGVGGNAFADQTTTFTYDFSSGSRTGSSATVSEANPLFSPTDYVSGFTTGLESGSGLSGGKAFAKTNEMTGFQSFSIASTGELARLESLTFDFEVSGFASATNTGRWVQLDVFASRDGFAADSINLGNVRITKSGGFSEPPMTAANFDLSTLTEFQGLTNTDVDFRMQFSASHSSGSQRGIVDNVALTLTSVPEPGALGILGLGAIAGLVRRRRRA